MTKASEQALQGLRDLTHLQWYVIPLLAIVLYIYVTEMKKARQTGNWNAIFAGLTVFGVDFINETVNGLIFHFTQYSALWTAPGETALRTMVGWNIEIMFMFAILGIIYFNSCLETKEEKILGIPNRWFWALWYAFFCVFIEILLNMGNLLIWEYSFWNKSFAGVWLIILFGYFHFFVAALLVIGMKSNKNKIIAIAVIYTISIVTNIVAFGLLGYNY